MNAGLEVLLRLIQNNARRFSHAPVGPVEPVGAFFGLGCYCGVNTTKPTPLCPIPMFHTQPSHILCCVWVGACHTNAG